MKIDEKQIQTRSTARTIVYYFIGSLLIVSLFFIIIELTTRTISWFSGNGFALALHELDPNDTKITSIYQWHPFIGFVTKPLMKLAGGHPRSNKLVDLRTDKFGFLAKDNSLNFQKQNNEIRIATIGASTTFNANLAYDDNWPGHLEYLLQKAFPDKKIRVINASVPGFDTSQSVSNLALRVMPFSPDIVIIYHAYNDLKAIQPSKSFLPDYSHIHDKPYDVATKLPLYLKILHESMFYVRTRNSYRQMLMNRKNYETKNSQTERVNKVPAQAEAAFRQHIESMIGIAQAGGARVVLSSFATLLDPHADYSQPKTVKTLSKMQVEEVAAFMHFTPNLTFNGILDGLNLYNRTLHNLAIKHQTGWVDNAKLIPHEDKYFVDRVHFDVEGAKLMAENFTPVVIKELKMNSND